MAYYLKGIGDRASGRNEILPQFDARIMYFLIGNQNGIVNGELNSFAFQSVDRGVRIRSGFMQAWGYFAMLDTDVQFNFVMPSAAAQFVQIFAEIDLSRVPQVFEIRTTAPSNSNSFSAVQNNLRTNPHGRFQLWLYTAQLNTNGTITFTDRRTYINKISDAITAENFTTAGGIATRFTGVDTAITSARNDLTASVNGRLPKMTQILGSHSYTMNSANVGGGTVNLISGTSIADGDMLLVNARVTNHGTFGICGLIRVHSSHSTFISHANINNGMPFNCLDTWAISIRRVNNTQISVGGNPRGRVRNDGAFNAGEHRAIWTHNADYTIDSIFKINL